jgi:hypothetical protein
MNRLWIAVLALVIAASVGASAVADPLGASEGLWSAADKCAREAARLFPDYTPKGNAARENYRRACLRAYNEPAPNGQASTSSN